MPARPSSHVYLILVAIVFCDMASPFSSPFPAPTRIQTRRATETRRTRTTSISMASNGDENESEKNPLKGTELTSALSRIDQQWQIQQQRAGGKSRWTKLMLPPEGGGDRNTENVLEDPPLDRTRKQDDYVYLLEPSNAYSSTPSCIILFVGGAGLGQFPHIAYSEFLQRLSDKLNASILAAPYTVGLDHFELAKQTGDRLRRAIIYCQDDPKRQYPDSLPTFALSHSLGCKLQTIYVAATAQEYRGIGFISYNNFGFGQTIQMARSFAEQLRGSYGLDSRTMEKSEEAFDVIFGMAETVLGAVGLDFSPNALNTARLIQLKFAEHLQQKTRMFVFDDDDIDTSEKFIGCCNGPGPQASGLPGNHLTPVYFKFGLDSLEDMPEETRGMARDFMGGFESASFGDEDHMNELVEEVSSWILGKDPGRPPRWKSSPREGVPKLTEMDRG